MHRVPGPLPCLVLPCPAHVEQAARTRKGQQATATNGTAWQRSHAQVRRGQTKTTIPSCWASTSRSPAKGHPTTHPTPGLRLVGSARCQGHEANHQSDQTRIDEYSRSTSKVDTSARCRALTNHTRGRKNNGRQRHIAKPVARLKSQNKTKTGRKVRVPVARKDRPEHAFPTEPNQHNDVPQIQDGSSLDPHCFPLSGQRLLSEVRTSCKPGNSTPSDKFKRKAANWLHVEALPASF